MKNILAILMALTLSGCDSVTVTGTVKVKGNEPHTMLVLATSDNTEYSLTGPLAMDIRNRYQNMRVKVAGIIVKKAIVPGFPAELEVKKILETYK